MNNATIDPTRNDQARRRASWRGEDQTSSSNPSRTAAFVLSVIVVVSLVVVVVWNFPAIRNKNVSDLATIAGELKSDHSALAGHIDSLVTGIAEKDKQIADLRTENSDLKKKLEKFEQAATLFREASAPAK